MSSARNHRIRSHRSYKNKVSAMEQFQRNQVIKAATKKAMKEKGNLFTKFLGLLKKGKK